MEWKIEKELPAPHYQVRVQYKDHIMEELTFNSKEAALSVMEAMKKKPSVLTLTLWEIKDLELHYKE